MPGQRRAPAFPKQLEPVVEQRHGFLDAASVGAAGGEFDREGYTIEFAADLADGVRVGVVQLEATPAGDRALHEQLYRRKAKRLRRGETGIIGRTTQRPQPMNMLTV